MKIIHFAKTNLTYDGRILTHLNTLNQGFRDLKMLFILLPDGKTKVDLSPNIRLKEFRFMFRKVFSKNILLQSITSLAFAFFQVFQILKFKPNIITVHDRSAALGPVILSFFVKLNIIYDDHELFEKPNDIVNKVWFAIEKRIINTAKLVFVANKQRCRIIKKIFNLDNSPIIIENFPNRSNSKNAELIDKIKVIKTTKKILLHQGRIFEERGLKEIKEIIKQLPDEWVLCTIGVPDYEFSMLNDNQLYSSKIYNFGYVKYEEVESIWREADATIIIYKTELINNRYCAPNRLYFAVEAQVPIIANKSNPVLYNYINSAKIGYLINERNVDVSNFFINYNLYKNNAIKNKRRFRNMNYNKIINAYKSLSKEIT